MNTKSKTERPQYRLAKRLFWTPILLTAPVFFIVGETVPDLNHGNIGDGFRKLNILVLAMLPIFATCWFASIMIVAKVDLPRVPKARLLIWLGVLIALALLVLAFWLVE